MSETNQDTNKKQLIIIFIIIYILLILVLVYTFYNSKCNIDSAKTETKSDSIITKDLKVNILAKIIIQNNIKSI